MNVSLSWLQDFVDLEMLGLPAEEVAATLTKLGLAVELLESSGDDWIFDLDVTTNRPDCLCHLGVARELAAQFRLKLSHADYTAPKTADSVEVFPASIEIRDPQGCPRYCGRVLTDVRIEESPQWLKERLLSVGQRPINNIVDVTNYVLFELGHPLHAFDYEELEGHQIVVRRARAGESLRTLDGQDRRLEESMLMICDADKPVAVAGVMGGAESEISSSTRSILLESAYFDPASVRRTSKELGLSTEASYRFERGADPAMAPKALNLACRLIQRISGAKCVSPLLDEYPAPVERPALTLRAKRVGQVLGIDLPLEDMRQILDGLEFEPSPRENRLECQVPSFRVDVSLEDDLVEEVARHYGYEQIESRYPAPLQAGRFAATEAHDRRIFETLVGSGFHEAINYSFVEKGAAEALLGKSSEMLAIANPLTAVETHLRTSLLPGLYGALRLNLNHGLENVRLFELATRYLPSPDSETSCLESPVLALLATGSYYDAYWTQTGSDAFSFFHLKGVLEALFDNLGLDAEFQQSQAYDFLHPGVAAEISSDRGLLGCCGEIHPRLLEDLKLSSRVYFAELDLTSVYDSDLPDPTFTVLGRFPSVERDLSFLLDKDVPFSTLESAVQDLKVAELSSIRLIDLYQGGNLPRDKVSLTVRLTFEASRNLTQEEVNERFERIVQTLRDKFSIEQR